jgi:hypothetical protein
MAESLRVRADSREKCDPMIDLNLIALVRHYLRDPPRFCRAGGGTIINISSVPEIAQVLLLGTLPEKTARPPQRRYSPYDSRKSKDTQNRSPAVERIGLQPKSVICTAAASG